MARVALDTNVLIYAELEPETDKGARAAEIVLKAAHDGVIAAQALGEFLRFVQRRAPSALEEAIRQTALYRAAFLTPPTTDETIALAAEMSMRRRLQFWDCVIVRSSAGAGATTLLTEDMQDGDFVEGVRLINPFNRNNDSAIEKLF